MQTTEAPPQETQTTDLEQYEALVETLRKLSEEVEHMNLNLDHQITALTNTIGKQSLAITELQKALPDPEPIVEENTFAEHPPATRDTAAQPNQPVQPAQPAQGQNATTTNQGAGQGTGQGKEGEKAETETVDLQLLAKRLTVIENDLRSLPPKLERGITSTIFSRFDPKDYWPHAIGAAVAA